MLRRLLIAGIACTVPVAANAARLVDLSEQDFAYVPELLLADLDKPGDSLKLNRPLAPFAQGVVTFAISPDGSTIAYTVDQDVMNDLDLFVVNIETPRTWIKIGSLPPGTIEMQPKFSPDGNFLAYVADAEEAFRTDAFLVNLLEPGVVSKLTTANHTTAGLIQFSRDSQYLTYSADGLREPYQRDLMIVPVDFGNDAMAVQAAAAVAVRSGSVC
jgi:Tol biopolymer transport system component